ncbi:hypothetical protein TcYC6_0100480 [Trypanosoma cruzi]|nr:hypothetical protein TcYC6_0100480 [Trypanosoma cruzi]
MCRCRPVSRRFLRHVMFFIAAVFFIWILVVDLIAVRFRYDDRAVGRQRTAARPRADMEELDTYSSMYCVGHQFNDPRRAGVASSFHPDGPRSSDGGEMDAGRVDIVLNGVFLPDKTHNASLKEDDMMGSADIYYYPIYNRTCLYKFVYFDKKRNKFFFYVRNISSYRRLLAKGKLRLPPVSLGSRPLELPRSGLNSFRRKSYWAFVYSPVVVLGPRPRDEAKGGKLRRHEEASAPYHNTLVAYFLPTASPWNFAHTLLCDLFGFFWGSMEIQRAFAHIFPSEMKFLSEALPDVQLIVTSFRYFSKDKLPNSNKAFAFFSRRPAIYDVALPSGVYRGLLAGTGTKSWSWVTPSYSASGSPSLWYSFRDYIIRHTGAEQRPYRRNYSSPNSLRPARVSICHKEDKRGIVNEKELLRSLRERFGGVEFFLETIVGRGAKEQVEMMLATDIFVCNEGTLATVFFLMNPGSVFVAIPLVYHSPHLHQRNMSHPDTWWLRPDLIRVDPRFNTGGNIDWFPPAIPWVRVTWYNEIPLSEASIQKPLHGLRNYMPEYNVRIHLGRFASLMERAIAFLRGRGTLWNVNSSLTLFKQSLTFSKFVHDGNTTSFGSFEERHQYRFVSLVPKNFTNVINNISLRRIFYLHETPVEIHRFRGRTHRPPNYSITADQCRRLIHLRPELSISFNTAICRYGMSFLCELFANGRYPQRSLHDKWRLSGGRCGGEESWPVYWRRRPESLHTAVRTRTAEGSEASFDLNEVTDYFFDVREERNLSHYLYFSKAHLLESYRVAEFGLHLKAEKDIVKRLFG